MYEIDYFSFSNITIPLAVENPGELY